MGRFSPFIYIVGDVGNATRKFSSSLVDVTDSVKAKSETGKGLAEKNKVGGVSRMICIRLLLVEKTSTTKEKTAEGEFTGGN